MKRRHTDSVKVSVQHKTELHSGDVLHSEVWRVVDAIDVQKMVDLNFPKLKSELGLIGRLINGFSFGFYHLGLESITDTEEDEQSGAIRITSKALVLDHMMEEEEEEEEEKEKEKEKEKSINDRGRSSTISIPPPTTIHTIQWNCPFAASLHVRSFFGVSPISIDVRSIILNTTHTIEWSLTHNFFDYPSNMESSSSSSSSMRSRREGKIKRDEEELYVDPKRTISMKDLRLSSRVKGRSSDADCRVNAHIRILWFISFDISGVVSKFLTKVMCDTTHHLSYDVEDLLDLIGADAILESIGASASTLPVPKPIKRAGLSSLTDFNARAEALMGSRALQEGLYKEFLEPSATAKKLDMVNFFLSRLLGSTSVLSLEVIHLDFGCTKAKDAPLAHTEKIKKPFTSTTTDDVEGEKEKEEKDDDDDDDEEPQTQMLGNFYWAPPIFKMKLLVTVLGAVFSVEITNFKIECYFTWKATYSNTTVVDESSSSSTSGTSTSSEGSHIHDSITKQKLTTSFKGTIVDFDLHLLARVPIKREEEEEEEEEEEKKEGEEGEDSYSSERKFSMKHEHLPVEDLEAYLRVYILQIMRQIMDDREVTVEGESVTGSMLPVSAVDYLQFIQKIAEEKS